MAKAVPPGPVDPLTPTAQTPPVPATPPASSADFVVGSTGAPRLESTDAPQQDGAPAVAAEPARTWTPEEAAHLQVAAHNIAGVGIFFGQWKKFEAWRADASEVMDTAPATARSLDRIAPAGGGIFGTVADALIASEGLVSLVAKKAAAVQEVDDKPRKKGEKAEASTAPTPAAARAGGSYQHPPELLGVLAEVDAQAAQRSDSIGDN